MIFSVVIVAFMLLIGCGISGKIRQSILEDYQKYDTSVQIDTEELFRYGMRTNIGNAFVYGDLKALDPVSFSLVKGKYSYIEENQQKYTMHTRLVTYTDDDGHTHTRTEEYWEWDTVHIERKNATKISFLNVKFKYEKIPFPGSHHIATVKTGFHRRNVYYGTDTDYQGTIFTDLRNKTINKGGKNRGQII